MIESYSLKGVDSMEMYQWLTAILVGGITGFVSHLINNQGK
ncbi:DUF4257 domain-containing protein, partial [Bacillus paranthracis]